MHDAERSQSLSLPFSKRRMKRAQERSNLGVRFSLIFPLGGLRKKAYKT